MTVCDLDDLVDTRLDGDLLQGVGDLDPIRFGRLAAARVRISRNRWKSNLIRRRLRLHCVLGSGLLRAR